MRPTAPPKLPAAVSLWILVPGIFQHFLVNCVVTLADLQKTATCAVIHHFPARQLLAPTFSRFFNLDNEVAGHPTHSA